MMRTIACISLVCLLAGSAFADVENVDVGGEIRVRARYWHNVYEGTPGTPPVLRFAPSFLPERSIGPFGAASRYDFDDRGNDLDFVEQRTRLHVRADLSSDVAAFIELESYDLWGEDFRSNYVTGADFRATSTNDLEVYQGFIEIRELFDHPLRLRIGRQEMKMGRGWLVDDITTALIGRSFDGIRLTYDRDSCTIDAFWSKLAERSPAEQDGDVDFYGLYATYKEMEHLNVSAYWFWIRDARSLKDTSGSLLTDALEDLVGLDEYGRTNMHTVGLRLWGFYHWADYNLELAYQRGQADQVGFGFKPYILAAAIPSFYGDDDAEFHGWAGDVEIGYTFDCPWQPRLFMGGAYFDGEDRRDVSFLEWLNPFDLPEASVSFNRLFPGKPYSGVLDINQDMSNFYQLRAGVEVVPTEGVTAGLNVAYFGVVEEFDRPPSFRTGRILVPIAPVFSFWTKQSDDDIGVTTHIWVKYDYSDDLFFRLGWEHLFPGGAVLDGNFVHQYGLELTMGTDDNSADYVYFDTGIRF